MNKLSRMRLAWLLLWASSGSWGDGANTVDIEVHRVPIADVLYELAGAANINLILVDDLDMEVSLRFKQVDAAQGLSMMCSGFALACNYTQQGLLIAPAAAGANTKLLPMERVKLHYTDADQVLVTLQNAAALLSPQGQLLADARSHQMLIYDDAEHAASLARIIRQLDQPLNQLLIESRIVIAKTDLGQSSGLDFIGSLSSGVGTGAAAGTLGIEGQGSSLGLGFGSTGGGWQLGLVGSHVLLQLELAALEASGKVLTLAQPQILVQEGYTGSIETGQEVPYVIATENGPQQQWKQAVLGLSVTPRILPHNQVQLDLLVMQDSVGDLLPNGQLALNTHRLKTRAVVGLGQTLVLGGALYEQQLERLLTSPLLAGLPLVGQWFEQRKRGAERFELLVFVTPRIVNP